MRQPVREIVERSYPNGRHDEPEERLIEANSMTPGDLRTLLREMAGHTPCEVFVNADRNYSVSYEVHFAHPSDKAVWAADRPPDEPRYVTIVRISRLGPVCHMTWNRVFLHDGRPVAEFLDTPPPELAAFATEIENAMAARGFEKLTDAELEEPVPWLSPGTATVSDPPLTIAQCLFSAEL
jgi:hypothetical protein